MSSDLVIFGSWYFSDVIAELATELSWNVIGRIDPNPPQNVKTLDCVPDGASCFVAIGDNSIRNFVTEMLKTRGRNIVTLVHPTATVSSSAKIGAGSYVGEHCVLRTKSALGQGVHVNAGAIVSHHCTCSDFSLLGPNATLGSRSEIGKLCLIGVSATVRSGCTVGNGCLVGAGSTVLTDVAENLSVLGNPAKPIRSKNQGKRDTQSNWSDNQIW